MSGRWVAGSTRAKSMAGKRIGRIGARGIAASPSLSAAVLALTATPYGHDVRVGDDLVQAQHGVWATLLWHLRVVAGWQPADGAAIARDLVAGFQIANAEDDRLFELGGLTKSYRWNHGPTLTRQLGWARSVATRVPRAAAWAAGAAAILVATRIFLLERPLTDEQRANSRVLLGAEIGTAGLPDFARRLPTTARWALRDVEQPEDLWQAERAWWHRVDTDADQLLHDSRFGPGPLVGLSGVLAVDAWRVQAALEVAARGGTDLEAFDAVV